MFYNLTFVSVETYDRKTPKGKKVGFSMLNSHMYDFNFAEPDTVKAMNIINRLFSHRFQLLILGNSTDLPTDHAYSDQCSINSKKLKDVEKVFRSTFLTNDECNYVINFYNDIITWQSTEAEEADGDDCYIDE